MLSKSEIDKGYYGNEELEEQKAKTKEELKEIRSDFNKILQDAIEAMKHKNDRKEYENEDNLQEENKISHSLLAKSKSDLDLDKSTTYSFQFMISYSFW